MDPIEILARAMCTALGADPDEHVPISGRPRDRGRPRGEQLDGMGLREPRWTQFAWEARVWLFTNSGGRIAGAGRAVARLTEPDED